MAITKAYFGFPRVTDSFTLSGGSWLATYPLPQLQRFPLSYVARSLDGSVGSTVIIATASAPVSASVIALVGHNLAQTDQIRVRTWTDVAGMAGLVDSGTMNVWPATYTADELDGAISTWVYRFANPGPATVGKIQIDITTILGQVQAGFLEIAAAFDVTYQFAPGSQWGFEWRSVEAVAIGGAPYIDDRPHPRIFKGSFDIATHTDAMGKFYEMQRQLKMDKPLLFVPLPADVTYFNKLNLFARQLDPGLSSIRGQIASNLFSGLSHSVPLSLKEIIG
jgi:hypothetical protein